MKVKFKGGRSREVLPATGARPFTANPGETYEVDDKTGRTLLAQKRWWSEVKPPKKQTDTKEG